MSDPIARRLAFLLGSFTGSEHMHASAWAPAGPATSSVEGTAELDGTLVVQRYRQWRDGTTSFELVAVWMVDPHSDEILYYGFDTAGFPADPPARGTWQDSGLVLERTTARGSSRLTVSPTSTGWSWTKEFRAPDASAWGPVQDAVFVPAGVDTPTGLDGST
jgi:hypothetical protein